MLGSPAQYAEPCHESGSGMPCVLVSATPRWGDSQGYGFCIAHESQPCVGGVGLNVFWSGELAGSAPDRNHGDSCSFLVWTGAHM